MALSERTLREKRHQRPTELPSAEVTCLSAAFRHQIMASSVAATECMNSDCQERYCETATGTQQLVVNRKGLDMYRPMSSGWQRRARNQLAGFWTAS